MAAGRSRPRARCARSAGGTGRDPRAGDRLRDRRGRSGGHRLHAPAVPRPPSWSASSRAAADACRCTWIWRSGSITARSSPGCGMSRRGLSAIAGPDRIRLRTDVELRGVDHRTVADFDDRPRASARSSTWSGTRPTEPEPRQFDVLRALEETEQWWRDWSGRCPDVGPWTEAVERSLITLKALTYAPTGGWLPRRRPRCPSSRAGCGTGTTAIAGSATPRSRSWPSCMPATSKKPGPGASGCSARWPASPRRSRSSTGWPASDG